MSKYFINGSKVQVGKDDDIKIHDSLPVGTYSVGFINNEFFLDKISDFSLPEKIYGPLDNNCERILNTFNDRPSATGVHLDGTKGSGKTLLVKKLSITGMERGLPTIVVNSAYVGELFNDFIQSISTPCIIVFDEFEKIYDREDQEDILTLFDGVYPSKKLFVLTTNDSRRVSNYLKNRPGRIYYKFEYNTLDEDAVREVLEDRMIDKSQIQSVLRYTNIFSFISFDMLTAIIEEMNRYGESLKDVLKVLNIQGECSEFDYFDVSFKFGDFTGILHKRLRFNPTSFNMTITNAAIWDAFMYTKPVDERIDFEDSPNSIEIGGKKLDISTYMEVDMSVNDLLFLDEETNSFEYSINLGDNKIDISVRKRKEVITTDLSDIF